MAWKEEICRFTVRSSGSMERRDMVLSKMRMDPVMYLSITPILPVKVIRSFVKVSELSSK